ncbi:MAG: 1-acyl-sn-glycerol-3-phosphate acyltransferase [Rhodospirillaceae bacterium]|nr:MAG: 1-acyl-sn-glycerol-3-phosphate acyltransferase [Rhodospirillaceae bacterium]
MIGLRLRSFLFNVGWYVGTTILAIVGSPILLMPRRFVVAWSLVWIDFCLWWLRITCRLTHRVHGLENMPTGPVIFACKHQSSWETLAFSRLFPGAATVMKRELVLIPIVGWAMARAGNIAVERGDGAKALRGLVKQAKATLEEGRSILIFPEGTRVAVGDEKPYQVGTAALYRQLGVPVVPVALNSGLFWGRRKFIKWPGVIDVEILPAIPPGLGRDVFMATLRERIEGATDGLVAAARKREQK